MYTPYHGRHIKVDNRWRIKTKLSDKRDDVKYPIVNFPYNSRNNTAGPCTEFTFILGFVSGRVVCWE